ncbi:bifunctional methylenetetrahydrofolate dehydrogenase/cyclohydrolase, mitochondrial isoform X1 [Tamandua tetradactyla]|uniref:bifunctional methylenetetrahydrofolate dehydrogenase/cyclohydrolase, mitochondrial isoform X1 n=1 Tax=Tamandua tetradactyla TaxID=48850 RepID=UPI004053CD6C
MPRFGPSLRAASGRDAERGLGGRQADPWPRAWRAPYDPLSRDPSGGGDWCRLTKSPRRLAGWVPALPFCLGKEDMYCRHRDSDCSRHAELGSAQRKSRNEAVVISGKKLAQQIKQEVRQEVEEWVASGNRRPHLSVVLVGENPASHSYVLNKTRAAADVGIISETILKPASISEEELLNLINKLNNDDNVDGLLVQLPLPEHIDERRVCNAVSPDKDVDGFHVINVGRMCLDQYSMLPATPWGVWEIIKRTGIPTLGKNVVVAGRSKNVGMPIAMLLHTDGAHERPGGDATVTISHRYTPKEQLKKHTILADIVVSAAGIPNLITADMIKEGAAIIDVGINRIKDPVTSKPKLVGDVDFEEVRKKAGYITPVPGGVGPMTVAMLMKNTIIAAKKLLRLEEREVLKPKELGIATN